MPSNFRPVSRRFMVPVMLGALTLAGLSGLSRRGVAEDDPGLAELENETRQAAAQSQSASESAAEPSSSSEAGQSGDDSLSELEGAIADPKGEQGDAGASAEAPAAPAPAEAAALPTESAAPATDGASSEIKNSVTNIEFKLEGKTSRIVVRSRNPLQYREVRNAQAKQVVYFFDNVETPQRLQRAFDTSEFPSAVALFTLLQMPGSGAPLTKLIVQLREDKPPTVTPNKAGLYIDFPPPDKSGEPRILIGDSDNGQAVEEDIYSGGKTFNGKQIKRLEIKNSDVQDVLRMLAKTSGYNIVVGEDVGGRVGTLSLENIPWDQAFALVLQSKKLGYVRQGNVIRVATLQSLKSEKDDALANEQAKIRVETLHTVLIPISYAKAADISSQAHNFLSTRGTISVDTRTNTVILRDIESVVTRVQKLFAALDTQPPRVSIAAKIMEISSGFSRSIGFSQYQFSEASAGLNVNNTTTFTSATGGQSTFNIAAPNFAKLLATFKLGEADNKVRTLASPSLSVVANQAATVNQSISYFVQTAAPPVAGVYQAPTLSQITANLTLNVTPIVASDGAIFLKVNVRNEVPSGPANNLTINSRSVNTEILLDNGDTAVVGGVFQNTAHESRDGIPFLMRIPILGHLFSTSNADESRTETFIFLTAKIMNPEESFKRSF